MVPKPRVIEPAKIKCRGELQAMDIKALQIEETELFDIPDYLSTPESNKIKIQGSNIKLLQTSANKLTTSQSFENLPSEFNGPK